MCKAKPQNRIDYIALHNPSQVARLVEKHGLRKPRNKAEVAVAARLLVKKKGTPVIRELVQLHPDKSLILQLTGHNPDESSFCGCHSAFSGEDIQDMLGQLGDLNLEDLDALYKELKKQVSQNPGDQTLADQADQVWQQVQQRRQSGISQEQQPSDDTPPFQLSSNWQLGLCIGVSFITGVILAKVL